LNFESGKSDLDDVSGSSQPWKTTPWNVESGGLRDPKAKKHSRQTFSTLDTFENSWIGSAERWRIRMFNIAWTSAMGKHHASSLNYASPFLDIRDVHPGTLAW